MTEVRGQRVEGRVLNIDFSIANRNVAKILYRRVGIAHPTPAILDLTDGKFQIYNCKVKAEIALLLPYTINIV
jgi:hypothetical protein